MKWAKETKTGFFSILIKKTQTEKTPFFKDKIKFSRKLITQPIFSPKTQANGKIYLVLCLKKNQIF